MSRREDMPSEVRALLSSACDGVLMQEDIARVEDVCDDDARARLLVDFLMLDADLFLLMQGEQALQSSLEVIDTISAGADNLKIHVAPDDARISLGGLFDSAYRGTVAYFSEIGPLSYLVATVLFALGALVGSWITVTVGHPTEVAQRSAPRAAEKSARTADAPLVARITGMVDCRWADPRMAPIGFDRVSLGRKYALAAGFMEITYDTGAKVILQGPCTYQVESTTGGYLSLGKLTARVDTVAKSQVLSPKTQDPRPNALFAVRTPTAVVTDLGTEFGVEVAKSGATRSHVFRGKIEMRPANVERNSFRSTAPKAERNEFRSTESDDNRPIQLGENESATAELGQDRAIKITRAVKQSSAPSFARQMPQRAPSVVGQVGNLSHSQPRYGLTDLGTLGGTMSKATAINAAGQVAGESTIATGAKHAFLYTDGKMEDLGTLGSGNSSASGINRAGQVVGCSGDREADCRAFLYSDGRMKDIGTLGRPSAGATAINDAGQIVGYSTDSHGVRRAFLYTPAKKGSGPIGAQHPEGRSGQLDLTPFSPGMKDLGALGGSQAMSFAHSINAAGLVVGYSETGGGDVHAFLYSRAGGMKDLGALGGHASFACYINDGGLAVGFVEAAGDASPLHDKGVYAFAASAVMHAFLYSRDAGMKNLGAPDGCSSMATGINNHGQVVGSITSRSRGNAAGQIVRAFLYREGKMVDLNSLVDPALGWTLLVASRINDLGQIAGYGIAPGGRNIRAFLLTPLSKRTPHAPREENRHAERDEYKGDNAK